MAQEKFDAIVVGPDPPAAPPPTRWPRRAFGGALERGEFPGAKNLFGGVLYRKQAGGHPSGQVEKAPVERRIVEQRIWLMGEESAVTLSHRNEAFKEPPTAGRPCASNLTSGSPIRRWKPEPCRFIRPWRPS
jgi:hypothetical protein